jgi:hypothetical protein
MVTGNTRPPIPPKQVKVYLDPPAEFETIGLVTAPSIFWPWPWIDVDSAIRELQKLAAKLGANGVLLLPCGEITMPTNGGQNTGNDCADPAWAMTAQGKAIFVKEQ